MGNKRIARVCILLTFGFVLGELVRTGGNLFGADLTTVLADNSADKNMSENQNIINVSSRTCEAILELGTSEFFKGYPVDMSFLLWVEANFGENSLMDIAYTLYEGNNDSNIWYEYTGNSMHVLWLKYCKSMNYATKAVNDVHWKEDTGDYCTTIDVTGDVSFANDWYTSAAIEERENGLSDCFSSEVITELNGADITMINHEYALTDSEDKLPYKGYNFKAPTQTVAYWKSLGADILALANNHVYDYKEQGLLDTLDTLQKAGYVTIGAGKNLDEASKIQYFVMNGKKIAFVNASEIERTQNLTKAASDTEAGVFKCLDESKLLSVVKNADKNADYVITYIHWGFEGYLQPDQRMKTLAEELVNSGADAILGGHPHRLQGVEFINNVPVAYSLGNFWFSSGSLYTTIAQINIDADGELSLSMIPCKQANMQTSILKEKNEKDGFFQYICDISTGIAMDPSGRVYNVKGNDNKDLPYAYQSGKQYDIHNPNLDLDGNVIDSVGNLR